MNYDIIARWNSVVGPDDVVWVLGDVVMGGWRKNLSMVAQLNGTKHLVFGNHDKPFGKKPVPAAERSLEYMEAGFASVRGGTVGIRLGDRGEYPAIMGHFPYSGDSRNEGDRYKESRPLDQGQWLLCGHVHDAWRQKGRQVNVGLDAWGGFPVALESVSQLIHEGPQEREVIPWQQLKCLPRTALNVAKVL